MAWATEDAKHYLAIPEEEYVEVQEVTFASRQSAMFVGFKNGKVVSPSKVIGREEARSIIHPTQTAIQHIIEGTEFGGHKIETKGFMTYIQITPVCRQPLPFNTVPEKPSG